MNDLSDTLLWQDELFMTQIGFLRWFAMYFDSETPIVATQNEVVFLDLNETDEELDLMTRKILFTNGCSWDNDGTLFKLV